MIFVGLILGILYSRLVQDSIYGYFDQLKEVPKVLAKFEALVSLPANATMPFYKSSTAIILLGVVPALIVLGCLLLQFLVEGYFENKRHKAPKRLKLNA
jgi:hypothetical protein